MNPKDFDLHGGWSMDYDDPPSREADSEPHPEYVAYHAQLEERERLWSKYFEYPNESPLLGVLVCLECGALVSSDWTHIDWHEDSE